MNEIIKINFTSTKGEAWDKLKVEKLKIGERFTTFRGYGPKKDKWYESNINKIFVVTLDYKPIAKAKLISKDYAWSQEIALELIKKDTFESFTKEKWNKQMEEFYGNDKVFGYMLTFELTEIDVNAI